MRSAVLLLGGTGVVLTSGPAVGRALVAPASGPGVGVGRVASVELPAASVGRAARESVAASVRLGGGVAELGSGLRGAVGGGTEDVVA